MFQLFSEDQTASFNQNFMFNLQILGLAAGVAAQHSQARYDNGFWKKIETEKIMQILGSQFFKSVSS